MADSPDTNLQLKKKARRRLVGAIAFAGLAAVILPMIMDEEPKQQIQDVQIRIPGQDEAPFSPKLLQEALPDSADESKAVVGDAPVATVEPSSAHQAAKPVEKEAEKVTEKAAEKTVEKPTDKAADKSPAKPVEKAADVSAKASDETKRAAAILSGKTIDPPAAAPVSAGEQFVILIGAFSNPANVKQLQTKIGELGVKVYTEPLDSPDGKKTRVRAGPFANRDAAEKALGKLKKIGVNGIVAAKQ